MYVTFTKSGRLAPTFYWSACPKPEMWAVINFGVRGPGFAFVIIFPLDLWNCSDSVLFLLFFGTWRYRSFQPFGAWKYRAFKPFGAWMYRAFKFFGAKRYIASQLFGAWRYIAFKFFDAWSCISSQPFCSWRYSAFQSSCNESSNAL